MSRIARALQYALPLSLGGVLGFTAVSLSGATLHAAPALPAITVTSPSTGASVSGLATVWAGASDAGFAGIQFQVNGVNLGSEITSGSCSITWDTTGAPEGQYALSAIARDDSGNVAVSPPVNVSVINSAPQIQNVNSTNVSDTAASISWTTNQATDGELDFGTSPSYTNSASQATGSTTHTIALNGLTPGTTFHFMLHAWNKIGLTSTTGDITFVTTNSSTPSTPPATTDPAPGTPPPTTPSAPTVPPTTPPTTPPQAPTSPVQTPPGAAVNQPPTVALTSPIAGSLSGVPSKIMLAANANDADGSVAFVDFYVNGVQMGRDTSRPYSLTWVNWNAGTYEVYAVATDNLGASARSGSVTVTVNIHAASGECAGPDPYAAIGGGTCMVSTWLPPGYSVPPGGPKKSAGPVNSGSGCSTPDPFTSLGGGQCVDGGWLPPGMATKGGSGKSTVTPLSCTTPDPFDGLKGLIGVCINKTWVPAISGKIGS